jgi:chromosome segregation ATPase
MARSGKDDSRMVAATLTAATSLLGNLFQAVDRAELGQRADALRAERDRLAVFFRRLEAAYHALRLQLAETQARWGELRREHVRVVRLARAWRQESRDLARQNESLCEERESLAARCTDREAEIRRLEALLNPDRKAPGSADDAS